MKTTRLRTILLAIPVFFICGLMDGVKDTLSFHYNQSIFYKAKNQQFWNPDISWRNKYKKGDAAQGPKFFLSTSVFSFTTDAWHLSKFIGVNVLLLYVLYLMMLYMRFRWYWLFLLWLMIKLTIGAGFHLIYTIIS